MLNEYKPKLFNCPRCITYGIEGSLWYNEIQQIYECFKCKAKGETLSDIELQFQITRLTGGHVSSSDKDLNHPELENPLLLSVKMFLADVRSWYYQYKEGRFVCKDFTQLVVDKAKERGIRCGYVIISFQDSLKGHAIVAFQTDYGLIYIEPQNGEEVDVIIGKHYLYNTGFSGHGCINNVEIKWNDGTITYI
jgi:hypothetical protein